MNKDTLFHFFVGVISIVIVIRLSEGVRWLALMSSTTTIQNEESCDSLAGLVKRQKKLCKRNVELMESVKVGAKRAIEECQFQFENRRWNCSTTDSKRLFGNVILKQGTREAAFVHAISSAGVAHAVTRACSSGQLQKCGCDRTVRGWSPEGFEWSGCSHNIAYGTAFSKAFVDAREKGKKRKQKNPARALMNLHNNEAGRRAIEDFMKVECKCHGVSGSCETKTCWKAMPSFREVGRILKEKFDGATEVRHMVTGTRGDLVPLNDQFKPHTEADLVYMAGSPDFVSLTKGLGRLEPTGEFATRPQKQ